MFINEKQRVKNSIQCRESVYVLLLVVVLLVLPPLCISPSLVPYPSTMYFTLVVLGPYRISELGERTNEKREMDVL